MLNLYCGYRGEQLHRAREHGEGCCCVGCRRPRIDLESPFATSASAAGLRSRVSVEEHRPGLDDGGLRELAKPETRRGVVQVHKEIVIVDVYRELEGLGQLVVAEEMVEELAGEVVDLLRILVKDLKESN